MSETDDIVERLRAWDKAYPEDIFPPVNDLEAIQLRNTHPGLIDRLSAMMGRHLAKFAKEAAAHITRLEERCAAYKGQVEAGAAETERMKQERDEALKELRLKWCISCGTLTSDNECDCTMDDDTAPLQDLKLFIDEYRRQTVDHIANQNREVAALKEEVGRLREALQWVDDMRMNGCPMDISNRARAALQPQEPKP